MPMVTAYGTLDEGLKVSLAATKARAIFLDPHLLKNLINPLKEAKIFSSSSIVPAMAMK
jgi:long-chain acyl-CoA synthetase